MDGSFYLKGRGLHFSQDFYTDALFLSSSSEANLFFLRHIFIIIFKEGTGNLFHTDLGRYSFKKKKKKKASAMLLPKIDVANISLLIPFCNILNH